MWANLHLLFWLSLIPFATGWMGENNFSRDAVVLYTALASFCGIAYYILLSMIKKSNPHNEQLKEVLRKQSKKGMISNVFYLVAIGAAFINPAITAFIIVLVAVMWFIPDKNIERTVKGS
jgi:uncharacterized membrane protein